MPLDIPNYSIEELREMMTALLLSQKETAARFQEMLLSQKDTAARFKEMLLSQKETEARFKDTDKQFKATDKRIKEAFNLFTNQWGRLMESLVEGDLVNLLRERGIKVGKTYRHAKGKVAGEDFEFDIVAENTDEVVLTEVKTTLRPEDVAKYVEKLQKVKVFFPAYSAYKIYGAVAFPEAHTQATVNAEHLGLFIIKATGDSASLINATDFKPKAWG